MKVIFYASKTIPTFLAIIFSLVLCLAFWKDEGNIIHERHCEDGIITTVKKISIDEGALNKRADIDLNRSPPRSPSPSDEGQNVEKTSPTYKPRGRKRKGEKRKYSNLSTIQKEKKRNATMIALRKYRSKWSDEAHEKAKKDLSPEEYSKYKEKYDNYKRLACQRAQRQYEREKKEVNENDPIAIERRKKRLKRYRDYYRNVQKPKNEKAMKDKNNDQDKHKPFPKRADPEIRLEIASQSEEVHQIVENDDQRKLELKRKRARDYNAKFTKKAEEEARKTLSKEEFEKVQERNKIFRAKRNKYFKAENARIKAGKIAGDEKATKRYERTIELKKKLYKKKSIGTFLSTGILIEKPKSERRRGKDDDLKELLERPLNFETKKEVERRLKHRQRGRELFKKNLDLFRKGDPKALDWHKNRKKSNREYMQRYRSEKEKAKLMNNENPPS